MNKSAFAYEIGYKAAVSNGACVFAQNKDAMALIAGLKPGEGSDEVITAFRKGVSDGVNESLKSFEF